MLTYEKLIDEWRSTINYGRVISVDKRNLEKVKAILKKAHTSVSNHDYNRFMQEIAIKIPGGMPALKMLLVTLELPTE